jgi:hypothetical protein
MYEMSLQGVPLSLPIEDAEVAYAQGLPYPPPPSTYGGGSASPGGASDGGEGGGAGAGGRSRRVSLEVEISRIGGIGATDGVGASGGARARRAVVAQPVPPSLHDLEDSDEEDARSSAAGGSLGGYGASGGMGARRASFGRRTSLSRSGQAAGSEPLDPAAEALGLGPGGEAFLSSEPLDPDTLRAHTVALVERKQARALAKDRAAEAARQAFLEGLPPSTAAALYGASVMSGPGGGLTAGSGGSVSGGAPGSFRHIHSSSSRRGSGADAAAGPAAGTSRSGESADSSRLAVGALAGGGGGGGSEAPVPDGALAASGFVPRPPSQPQGRGSFRTQHMHRAAPGSAASGGGTPKGANR